MGSLFALARITTDQPQVGRLRSPTGDGRGHSYKAVGEGRAHAPPRFTRGRRAEGRGKSPTDINANKGLAAKNKGGEGLWLSEAKRCRRRRPLSAFARFLPVERRPAQWGVYHDPPLCDL